MSKSKSKIETKSKSKVGERERVWFGEQMSSWYSVVGHGWSAETIFGPLFSPLLARSLVAQTTFCPDHFLAISSLCKSGAPKGGAPKGGSAVDFGQFLIRQFFCFSSSADMWSPSSEASTKFMKHSTTSTTSVPQSSLSIFA